MPDSDILGIPQVAPNQNNKETTINDGISIIERSLNDVYVEAFAADTTISATNFRRHQVMHLLPSSGGLFAYVPVQKRFFAVYNPSGTHSFTLRRTGDVSGGVTVPAGSYVICYQDGTNPLILVADSAAAAFASTFITLSDAPGAYTGAAGQLTRVNATEDGLEFWTLEQALIDLSDTPSSYTPLQYLRVNAAGDGFEYVSANPGGETEFILLTDVPLNYTGSAGYFVKVKATADGLEFVDGAGLFDFTDLGDVPTDYTGESGRLIAVNATADGLEFVDFPSFGAQITLALSTANDGFEAGILNPWEPEDEADLTYYAVDVAAGAYGPGAGSYSMVVDTSVVSTSISLTLDLTLYADASALDNSARVTVPYLFIDALGTGAEGLVEVECLSAVNAVLTTLTSGTITSPGAWLSGSVVGNIPSGTRSIRIVVTSGHGGSPLVVGWDGFACQLRITESVSFIDLPDTPVSYTGNAGKIAKVNGDEDALEFASVAATEITGMPASLAGSAGMSLIVNPGATGYTLAELFPGYAIGEALMYLRVNATGDALEWATVSGGGGVSDGDKGDITVSGTGATWTIDAGVVTNAKMADMATARIKGRTTAGDGAPEDLTGTEATALLDVFTSGAKGLAPASGGGTSNFLRADGTWAAPGSSSMIQSIIVAVGDETTAHTVGAGKVTFRMPYAFTLTDIRASLTTAQASGSILTVDVNENGVSILSTPLTIDNTEKTSTTAATPAVISDTALADDAEITIDIDQVGSGSAAGLKVALIGYKT